MIEFIKRVGEEDKTLDSPFTALTGLKLMVHVLDD